MPDEAPFQDFPSYIERSSQKPRVFLIFGLLLLLVIGLFAGLYFLGVSSKKSSVASVPTPIVTPTILPTESAATASGETTTTPSEKTTPSPTEKTDKKTSSERSDLQISVLNGSGVVGAAKGISSHLRGLGYTIKTVGNADSFTYTNITVKVKKSSKAALTQLKKDIQEYDSELTIEDSVDDTISTDAVVIVGK